MQAQIRSRYSDIVIGMNVIIRTGFQPVTHSIDFDPQKYVKGKKLAEKHIQRVEESSNNVNTKVIKCSCIRTVSVNEPPYKVQLQVSYKCEVYLNDKY